MWSQKALTILVRVFERAKGFPFWSLSCHYLIFLLSSIFHFWYLGKKYSWFITYEKGRTDFFQISYIARYSGILIESHLIDDVYVLYILITMYALIYIHLLLLKLLGITLVSVSVLQIIFDICDAAMSWLLAMCTTVGGVASDSITWHVRREIDSWAIWHRVKNRFFNLFCKSNNNFTTMFLRLSQIYEFADFFWQWPGILARYNTICLFFAL